MYEAEVSARGLPLGQRLDCRQTIRAGVNGFFNSTEDTMGRISHKGARAEALHGVKIAPRAITYEHHLSLRDLAPHRVAACGFARAVHQSRAWGSWLILVKGTLQRNRRRLSWNDPLEQASWERWEPEHEVSFERHAVGDGRVPAC
jgi:hypothetical protein